ncbi:MAG TPA: AraC family transcriptional regulator [Candidatus Dormibacteraeota bacterium]|jgi:AraC family transcriptional regulator|nr:AraC family transcriptional regulator [Candidatus Dormibacteraeota bacterium]
MSTNLQTGQFYGATRKRFETAGLVLTEVHHVHGRKLPVHTHESAYFGLLLDGGYTERFTQRATEYGPFTIGFHPPGLTHEDEIPVCGSLMFCIEVRDIFWQRARQYMTAPKFTPDLYGTMTTWLGVRLYQSFRAGTLDALQMEEICGDMLERCAQVNLNKEQASPEWVKRALDLLHGSFRTQITLDAVADELDLHPIHLSRVFRKKHGCTMGEYVNRLRVQFVCAKMSQGWPALDEIALSAGFADQSHMGRVFKSIVGETPAKFREFLHNAAHNFAISAAKK